MPKFSILVRLQQATPTLFRTMVASLKAQTVTDWQLVCVVGKGQHLDRLLAEDEALTEPRIEVIERPVDELLAWSANQLLDQLGDWTGFIGQYDQLIPHALELMDAGITANAAAKVIYSDEESFNRGDHTSMRFQKGQLNPVRLRYQEYLRDFVLIQTAHLASRNGFSLMASDWPTHNLYLETLEEFGASAFVNIPERLYRRYRNHLEKASDIRFEPHMVGFDLYAIKAHLARCQIPAFVRQVNGTPDIEYRFEHRPHVTAFVVIGDDVVAGMEILHRMADTPQYRPLTVKVVHQGLSWPAEIDYREVCRALGFTYVERFQGNLAERLNQLVLLADTELVLFLQGMPISPKWLHKLVDHAMLPGAGAVGARTMTPVRLHQPGIPGYRYEGWDWNTRGQFNLLQVPHQTSAVSPACLLVDTRKFLEAGSFDDTLPTLYGMDFCLRLDQAGMTNVAVPDVHVMVSETAIPALELEALQQAWSGWNDPFRLHQSL